MKRRHKKLILRQQKRKILKKKKRMRRNQRRKVKRSDPHQEPKGVRKVVIKQVRETRTMIWMERVLNRSKMKRMKGVMRVDLN